MSFLKDGNMTNQYLPQSIIKESEPIKFIELCPSCGANRTLLKEMLNEHPELIDGAWLESENKTMAKHIISGCQSCSEWYETITKGLTVNV
jgi:hypothetical protein